MRNSETDYTIATILSNPVNESPWRYLRGLYKDNTNLLITGDVVPELCFKVLNTHPKCVHALSFFLDLLCYGLQPSPELRTIIESMRSPEQEPSNLSLAGVVCFILVKMDPMRANYWVWRRSKLPTHIG